jgi:hypothetical protein
MPDAHVHKFYGDVLDILHESKIPILIGGAFAQEHFTGVSRDTKDLDIFVRETDLQKTLNALNTAGYRTETKFTHWLAKAYDSRSAEFVDIIFNSGNGLCKVDDAWFDNAPCGIAFGRPVKFCPIEEAIWQKAFIMERERYDGADIAHLLRAHGETLDWQRLLGRFGDHWRVLLSYITLYAYIYPTERSRIPDWVQRRLLDLAANEIGRDDSGSPVCAGTFLSRAQFQVDVEHWNYRDSRIPQTMSPQEVERWTSAAAEEQK